MTEEDGDGAIPLLVGHRERFRGLAVVKADLRARTVERARHRVACRIEIARSRAAYGRTEAVVAPSAPAPPQRALGRVRRHQLVHIAPWRLRACALAMKPLVLDGDRRAGALLRRADRDALPPCDAPAVWRTRDRIDGRDGAHRDGHVPHLETRRVGDEDARPVGDHDRLAHVAVVSVGPRLVKVKHRDAKLLELDGLAGARVDKVVPQRDHVCRGRVIRCIHPPHRLLPGAASHARKGAEGLLGARW